MLPERIAAPAGEDGRRIETAIGAINYRPSPHARRPSLGRSDTIGLVIPNISNPFFGLFAAAVEPEADRRELGVSLFATLNRPGREITYLQMLERNHVDGLIFLTTYPDDGQQAKTIDRAGRVVVDEDVPKTRAPKLFAENVAGGRLTGDHLGAVGHERIFALVGHPATISVARRLPGLRAGLAAHGDDPEITVWHGDYTRAFGIAAAQRFADGDRPATAIFSTADEITIGLMQAFRDRCLVVPRDVSLVGFDDDAPQHLFEPPITSVRQPVSALGQQTLTLLADTDWRSTDGLVEQLLLVNFVVRGSVAPPAHA